MISKLITACIFALMAIAAVVFGMVLCGLNAWALIATYWAVLTVKNALDWLKVRKQAPK